MSFKDLIIARSNAAYEKFLPHISVDCVVFGFHDATLKVLLTKLKDSDAWLLPGGYMGKEEELNDAANRLLYERTGVSNIYLQQFKVFSEIKRSEPFFSDDPAPRWDTMRFFTVGFDARGDDTKVQAVPDEFSSDIAWHDVAKLPNMGMDHAHITAKALIKLRRELNYKPVGYNLLPEIFTMPELQRLYEAILNKPLNRGNFYRKMMAYDILDKMPETRKGGAHKAPNLYRFNLERYTAALQDGLKEGW